METSSKCKNLAAKMVKFFICAVITLHFMTSDGHAATVEIAEDTVWQESRTIEDTIIVKEGKVLTVGEGVILEFRRGGSINAYGDLVVKGVESSPVVFTRNLPRAGEDRWAYYITIGVNSHSSFEYFIMKKAGGYFVGGSLMPGMRIRGMVAMTDSLITENTWALEVRDKGSLFMRNCDVYGNNSTWGVQVLGNEAVADASENYWGDDTGPLYYGFNSEGKGEYIKGKNISFAPWTQRGKRPVVLVPGLGGSFSFRRFFGTNTTEDSWILLPPRGSLAELKREFERSGYQEGRNLFIGFYDWRLSCRESSAADLAPVIQQAKSKSGFKEIDIVAHSFGGVIARSYIQRKSYQYDVQNLVTIGTPHQGASQAYLFAEGGMLPPNWDPLLYAYLWYKEKENGQADLEYIRNNIPSIFELLPTYDFLRDSSTGNLKSVNEMFYRNHELGELNENLNILTSRVRAHFIAGTGHFTLDEIPVRGHIPEDGDYWIDGMPDPPIPAPKAEAGDGTVLLKSAHPENWQGNKTTIEGSHSDLPIASSEIIARALDIRLEAEAPSVFLGNFMMFLFASPVSVEIYDQQGKALSASAAEIPEGYYFMESAEGKKIAVIHNPGEFYTIEITGVSGGSYRMLVLSQEGSGFITAEASGKVALGQKRTYAVAKVIDEQGGVQKELQITEKNVNKYVRMAQLITSGYEQELISHWNSRQELLAAVLDCYEQAKEGNNEAEQNHANTLDELLVRMLGENIIKQPLYESLSQWLKT